MACINPDGTLSIIAQQVLARLGQPAGVDSLAANLGLPLWRVRATLREIGRAGLVEPLQGDPSGAYLITDLGREVLEIERETHA